MIQNETIAKLAPAQFSPAQPSPSPPHRKQLANPRFSAEISTLAYHRLKSRRPKRVNHSSPVFIFLFFFHFFLHLCGKKKTTKLKKERSKKKVSQGYRSCSCFAYLSRKVDPSIRSMGLFAQYKYIAGNLSTANTRLLIFGGERLEVGIEGRDVRPIIRAYLCLQTKLYWALNTRGMEVGWDAQIGGEFFAKSFDNPYFLVPLACCCCCYEYRYCACAKPAQGTRVVKGKEAP